MTEEQALFPFEIDLKEFGGRHVFLDSKQLSKWLEDEKQAWDWIQKYSNINLFANIQQKQRKPLDSCSSWLQQANQQVAQNQISNARSQLDNIRNTLVGHYCSNKTGLYSSTPKATFIFKLCDEGRPRIAILVLATWINVSLQDAQIHEAVDAGIERVFFEKGIKERALSEKAALAKLATDMQSVLSDGQLTQHEHCQKFAEQEQALITLQEELKQQFADAQQARSMACSEQMTNYENKLNQLQKTYDAFMTIQAPVLYWEAKRIRHRNWSWGSGAVTLGAMVGAWCLLSAKLDEVKTGAALAANKLAASQPAIASKVQTAADAGGSWHFDVAVLVLLGTLSFWVIRLLVRVFLSHLHLENDAAERATMARTYLALLRRGKLPEGDDLKTVLAALFRPSGDGIVKDEGMPPSMVDFLTKLGR